MKTQSSFLILCACLAAGASFADSLDVTVGPAAMRIAPGVAERRAVRLPGLELDVSLYARCSNGALPETITLSSADTRQRYSGDALGGAATDGVKFMIPARQLPPLSSRDFCVSDRGLEQPLTLAKPGFVSLYATLRCAAAEEGAVSLTTTTAIIDVRIECDRELLEAAQEPSSDSASDRNSRVRRQD